MEVTVTFDTSIPEDKKKLQSLFTEDEIAELAELSEATVEADSAPISEEDEISTPLKDQIEVEGGTVYPIWNGEKTRFAEVAEYLLENPWSLKSEISEATGLGHMEIDNVLTHSKWGELFYSRNPAEHTRPQGAHGNSKEWGVTIEVRDD